MEFTKVTAIYFSPTGSTKRIVRAVLSEFDFPKSEIDLTSYENRNKSYAFGRDELVIFGVPVYGDRVPSIAEQRIKQISGNETCAILLASYGNVHCQRALYELQQITKAIGFITVAAVSVVSRHNIMREIGIGRPNQNDWDMLSDFTTQIKQKLNSSEKIESITVVGKASSHPRDRLPIKPHANDNCTACGVCIKQCPVGAISNPKKTSDSSCVRCMRCIHFCPQHARTYGKHKEIIAKIFLKTVSRREKHPKIFI